MGLPVSAVFQKLWLAGLTNVYVVLLPSVRHSPIHGLAAVG